MSMGEVRTVVGFGGFRDWVGRLVQRVSCGQVPSPFDRIW